MFKNRLESLASKHFLISGIFLVILENSLKIFRKLDHYLNEIVQIYSDRVTTCVLLINSILEILPLVWPSRRDIFILFFCFPSFFKSSQKFSVVREYWCPLVKGEFVFLKRRKSKPSKFFLTFLKEGKMSHQIPVYTPLPLCPK